MKIGLFGGSFDPIHKGHVALAQEAMKQLSLDAFYFIPTKNNPWKQGSYAGGYDRAKMIKIALHDEPSMSVCTIEIDQPTDDKNYTYDTLLSLTQQHPEDEFYYLMGMDQVASFHEWKKPKKISKLVQLVAFNRGGFDEESDNLKKYHFIKIDNEPITASSTAIREGDLSQLDPAVMHYIAQKGFYLDMMIKSRMCEKRYRHSLSVAALCKEFAESNGENVLDAWIAGVMHDVAKEMNIKEAEELMKTYYPAFINSPKAIWHQWLGAYVCAHEFMIDNEVILKAIEDHTTASLEISRLGKCLYCADKLDPLRGYDSSASIALCKKDIDEGFKQELINFYEFSKEKNRPIDPVFFGIYNKFVEGE